jgi:single-strand DNA-binding protein
MRAVPSIDPQPGPPSTAGGCSGEPVGSAPHGVLVAVGQTRRPDLGGPVLEPLITVVGHVGRPPRQRTLAGGTVVADFRLASTPRRLDKATGQWSDGETLWFGVTCWRALADHATASLNKGDKVVVTGRLLATSWTTEQGEVRTGLEIDASAVGLDLSRGPATQHRPERAGAAEGGPAEDQWTEGAGGVTADPTTGEVVPAVPRQVAA